MSQQIKFYNVTINYSDLDSGSLDDDLGMGQCYARIEDQKICVLLNQHKKLFSYGANLPWVLEEWELEDVLELNEADDILFLLYALTELEPFSRIQDIQLTVSYDHLIWLLHDFYHVCNDVYLDEDDLRVQVFYYTEREAIKYSISMLNDLEIPLPYHILEQTKSEFEERFREPLHIEWPTPVNQYQNLDKFNIGDWF